MHGTVRGLVELGELTPRRWTTADDLELAATWLEQYEGDPADDGDNMVALATVARGTYGGRQPSGGPTRGRRRLAKNLI